MFNGQPVTCVVYFVFETSVSWLTPVSNLGSQREEKELEPWDSSCGLNGDDNNENINTSNVPLELEAANGWDANDMFRKNEQIYGVQSTYDHTLAGYTLPLQPNDSEDYR